MSSAYTEFPVSIEVAECVSSRYVQHRRPLSWDLRRAGIDTIRTTDGRVLRLESSGDQSPPRPGWTIVLMSGDDERGYAWTLYGIRSRIGAEADPQRGVL